MKRRDLIKFLKDKGCVLTSRGGNHDWFTNLALRPIAASAATHRDKRASTALGYQKPN